MEGTLVGRDALLDEVSLALTGGGTVLLEGPAGIGKTSVFRAVLDRAAIAGVRVLMCAPTEAETTLPLAAVADLLQPLAELVVALPDGQRQAVEAALSGESGVDERALSSAVRELLDRAAAEGPVLVAVDDAPWLDPPSERALRYALRRTSAALDVLVAVRTSGAGTDTVPLGLTARAELHAAESARDAAARAGLGPTARGRLTRVAIPPLGAGALHHVLRTKLGRNFSRPLVTRLARDSGGNALLAIEMGRAVLRLPAAPGPAEDLPVVASMQELVTATLEGLDEDSRHAVRLAALLSAPATAVLVAAGVAATALDQAEEAGLLAVRDDGRIAFAHPVHAAAVRASVPSGVRRRLHAELAAVSTDPDERARQLARCTTAADAEVAAELAAAAERVRTRGAPELAADLYDRAADLTPDGAADDRLHRRLSAVHCRYDSGDYPTAGAQAETIAAGLGGQQRAEALLLRAAVAWSADEPFVAVDAATRALEVADPESPMAGRIHAHLGVFVDLPGPAREHAEAARRLLAADSGPDRPQTASPLARSDSSLLASVLMLLFLNEFRAGLPPRLELLNEALALEGAEPSWLAGTIPAIWWKGIDDRDRAVDRLLWMLDRAGALGEEPFQHELIAHLGEAELLAGRFDAAAQWIGQARDLGEQLGTSTASESWLAGLVDVYAGRIEQATATADEGLRQAAETGEPWLLRIHLLLSGLAALAAGRYGDAAGHYAALAAEMDATGIVEQLGTRFEADWVEAAVAIGDLDSARAAQQRLVDRNTRFARPWTVLGVARGDVLLAAASGAPVDAAIERLLAAHGSIAPDVVPFDRARCLLVAGQAHRRARRKAPARDLLARAAEEFDTLGAVAWAERARAELARVSSPRPAGAGAGDLSATEQRVAALAALGRTNRAIADELFISAKTVEANLGRVYRKLGITTRAELGAALTARDT